MQGNSSQPTQTKTKNKIKILWVSDYNVPTGYGEVSENILHRLDPEKYEVHVLACNYTGIKPVFPARFPVWGSHSSYGLAELTKVFDEVKPDILFTLNDGYVMPYYYQTLGKRLDLCKWVGYVVFDGAPLDAWAHSLNYIDAVIVPTKWQKDLLAKIGINSMVISHGVDTDIFKPLSDKEKEEYKVSLLGEKMKDRFVFGMVAKNFPRKRFAELIYAFKLFKYDDPTAKLGPEPMLILYATGRDAANLDLSVVCGRVGLKPYDTAIIKPPDERGLTSEEMNKLYNLFDVNCLISVGEGYGLPIINSAACGKSSVVVDNTVMREHDENFSLYMCDELSQPTFFEKNNAILTYLPDCDSLKQALATAYHTTVSREVVTKNNFNKSINAAKERDWRNIVPRFDMVFDSLSKVNKEAVVL